MKRWFLLLPLVFLSWGITLPALAVCPLCTVVVAVGLGVSRWLGVDDAVSGVWIGGLVVMVSWWTLRWLKKKRELSAWLALAIVIGYYLVTVGTLVWLRAFGHPLNQLWGMDKLGLGIAAGSVGVYAVLRWSYWLKKRNNGKSYFTFQRTVMSLGSLIILSAIFYFLSK